MKTLVILQSSYIPWKGYFDLIAQSDEFVLFDEVQFTRRDWRNRNQIKTSHGLKWLSIPVKSKGKYEQKIDEVEIADPDWAHLHWSNIRHAYKMAPHFKEYEGKIASLYERAEREISLCAVNKMFLVGLCELLNIPAVFISSSDYPSLSKKSERLIELCQARQASHYLSGPAAKQYLDDALFQRTGIQASYMDYSGYPEYPQLWGPFVHEVSVIDAIFNLGPLARDAIRKEGSPGR